MVMDKSDWQSSWQLHLEQYLNSAPRTGFFIHSILPSIKSSLEIACGSSRDSIYLAKMNVSATACDYEENLITELQTRFVNKKLKYVQADAFHLPFPDNSYDLVFHNGLFILFSNNEELSKMLKEQERVAKHYILVLVHNKLNVDLQNKFLNLAKTDPIYNIRFFQPDEIESIIRNSLENCKSIKSMKFGGKADIFSFKRLKRIIPNLLFPFHNALVPKLYRFQKWEQTERIACLITLNK